MQDWNTTGWFNHEYSNIPVDTGTVYPIVPAVNTGNRFIGDIMANIKQYMNDPTKAPQQFMTNLDTASLGTKINSGLGTIGGLLQAYNAFQANKLAKKQLQHEMNAYNQNMNAQRKMTNSKLEDRQARRVHEANAHGRQATSVADYMAKYGV